MSEPSGLGGLLRPGQSVIEHAGGFGERDEAIRHTANLVLRRLLEVCFWIFWAPLALGPWCLVYYVPWLLDRAVVTLGAWLSNHTDPPVADVQAYHASLLCVGAGTAGVLLLFDVGPVLFWWPWPWQATRASLWGLLWPDWWPAAIPVVVLIRLALVAGPLVASAEVWYLDQRQRQEVLLPTMYTPALETVLPHQIEAPGIYNPYRDPAAPSPPSSVVRAMFHSSDGNGRGGLRIVDVPEELATLEQVRQLADALIIEGYPLARNVLVGKLRLFTDPGWRNLQEWMVEQRLARKTGSARNAGYQLTEDGAAWLQSIAQGEERPL